MKSLVLFKVDYFLASWLLCCYFPPDTKMFLFTSTTKRMFWIDLFLNNANHTLNSHKTVIFKKPGVADGACPNSPSVGLILVLVWIIDTWVNARQPPASNQHWPNGCKRTSWKIWENSFTLFCQVQCGHLCADLPAAPRHHGRLPRQDGQVSSYYNKYLYQLHIWESTDTKLRL